MDYVTSHEKQKYTNFCSGKAWFFLAEEIIVIQLT